MLVPGIWRAVRDEPECRTAPTPAYSPTIGARGDNAFSPHDHFLLVLAMKSRCPEGRVARVTGGAIVVGLAEAGADVAAKARTVPPGRQEPHTVPTEFEWKPGRQAGIRPVLT